MYSWHQIRIRQYLIDDQWSGCGAKATAHGTDDLERGGDLPTESKVLGGNSGPSSTGEVNPGVNPGASGTSDTRTPRASSTGEVNPGMNLGAPGVPSTGSDCITKCGKSGSIATPVASESDTGRVLLVQPFDGDTTKFMG